MDSSTVLSEGTQTEALRSVGRFCEDIVNKNEGGGEMQPSWFIIREDGQLEIAVTPFVGAEEFKLKDQVRTFIALKLIQTKAKRYLFASEAWALAVDKDEFEKGTHIMPSKSERRTEVLIIVVADANGDKSQLLYEIERDADNKRTLKMDPEQVNDVQGEMVSLFERAEKIKNALPPGGAVDDLLRIFEMAMQGLRPN